MPLPIRRDPLAGLVAPIPVPPRERERNCSEAKVLASFQYVAYPMVGVPVTSVSKEGSHTRLSIALDSSTPPLEVTTVFEEEAARVPILTLPATPKVAPGAVVPIPILVSVSYIIESSILY